MWKSVLWSFGWTFYWLRLWRLILSCPLIVMGFRILLWINPLKILWRSLRLLTIYLSYCILLKRAPPQSILFKFLYILILWSFFLNCYTNFFILFELSIIRRIVELLNYIKSSCIKYFGLIIFKKGEKKLKTFSITHIQAIVYIILNLVWSFFQINSLDLLNSFNSHSIKLCIVYNISP